MSNAATGPASLQMDRMYRWQRHIYDFTRKPYLLGRDRMIASLGVPQDGHVLEIGCGTGRNLIQAARRYPHGFFYGFDIAGVMLETADRSIRQAGLAGRIRTALGDATGFNTQALFGRAHFDRVFISYSLSMIPGWRSALELALDTLAPGGALLITDFYDGRNVPAPLRSILFAWLRIFAVYPRQNLQSVLQELAAARGLKLEFEPLYGGYAVWAMVRRPIGQGSDNIVKTDRCRSYP
ncbi:MAG: class I SAM-dependent methyltransferase [Hyphomicrobiales bacterium]|nr:class I SAM-dependent methyltransferase [Hyphomicrobiales bacterium]